MEPVNKKIIFVPPHKLEQNFHVVRSICSTKEYLIAQIKVPTQHDIEYTLVEMVSKGPQDGHDLEGLIKKLNTFSHPSLYSLTSYSHDFKLNNNLKHHWKISLFYEPFTITLEEFIQKKKQSQHPLLGILKGSRLSDATIVKFIDGTVSLFERLESFGEPYNPIHPRNFVFTPEHNVIKFNAFNFGKFKSLNFEVNQTTEDLKAPEELTLNKSGKLNPKARVFHLGMIFLSLASLESMQGLNQDKNKIEAKIDELGNEYSSYFIETLRRMLAFKEEDRLDFKQLNSFLKENSLMLKSQKENSYINNSPRKESEDFKEIERSKSNSLKGGSYSNKVSKTKIKPVNEEQTGYGPKLLINLEKSKPSYKVLFSFMEDTKKLAMVVLKQLASLYIDVVELDIPFTIPRKHTSIYTENDRFYLIGGYADPLKKTNCYYYSISQGKMEAENPSKETVRLSPGVVNIEDCIFVMGGTVRKLKENGFEEVPLKTCEMLDMKNGAWKSLQPMNFGCSGAVYCSHQKENIYKIGGKDESGNMNSNIEKYSIIDNLWVLLGSIKYPNLTLNTNVIGAQINMDEIFVFGNGEKESIRQTYLLNLNRSYRDAEYITFANKHCPQKFAFGEIIPNQGVISKNQIVFLSKFDSGFRVSSFDGKTWKELKQFRQEHLQ